MSRNVFWGGGVEGVSESARRFHYEDEQRLYSILPLSCCCCGQYLMGQHRLGHDTYSTCEVAAAD